MPEIFDQQYIGGSWRRASGTQLIDVEDPNTGLVSAQILPGTEEDVRISVKVISGFGERDQGRKVVLRGQEIVA